MIYIDAFNGDADGLCALIQLRLDSPRSATLVTGIKRDINLLKKIASGENAQITVLDISFEKNSTDVARLLNDGASLDYIDHHKVGDLVKHPNLNLSVDLSANTCTSLIVDKRLEGKYRAWAITAAFGDNLFEKASNLAQESGFSLAQIETMKQLGVLLNYNGYGASLEDLFFNPADLFEKLRHYKTPFEFLDQDDETHSILKNGYNQDMALADSAPIIHQTDHTAVIEFPNEVWARRVSGVFGNELANRFHDRAHAVITKNKNDGYLVSVRAPLNRKSGADELVSKFPTGGGRKAAAGINNLPVEMLSDFISALDSQFKV
jgi:oligoribonuclease NrnB/cAMP/cGMP phosphodiesterase (DHH superfamily)